MIIFHTALRPEASPFISLLGLKKDISWHTHELYRANNIMLLVSGTGKVRTAVALAALLGSISRELQMDKLILVNTGIAGGHQPVGSCFQINKVSDIGSLRRYYPDMIVKSPFAEAPLTTVEVPVTDGANGLNEAVDMEASGFMEASRPFCGTHQLAMFKVISDNYGCGNLTVAKIEAFIASHAEAIIEYAGKLSLYIEEKVSGFSEAENNWLTHLTDALELSHSQSQMLTSWAKSYHARGGNLLEVTPSIDKKDRFTRDERKKILQSLKTKLYTPEILSSLY